MAAEQKVKPPKVLAVGSGKGGVGKSMFSTNLGTMLALQGHRVLLVDADFGGANLHSFLGVQFPKKTLSDFLRKEVKTLAETAVRTSTPGLWLISGDRAIFDIANLCHAQKLKMIRQIFNINVDYVILDLGAGSAFNTIDFFNIADHQIVVVTPTQMSIDNAYHFLKASFYRKFKQVVSDCQASRYVSQVYEEQIRKGAKSFSQLMAKIQDDNHELSARIRKDMCAFRPRVIVNQSRNIKETEIGHQIAESCSGYFGVSAEYLGSLQFDAAVFDSIQQERPAVLLYPDGSFTTALRQIAESVKALP